MCTCLTHRSLWIGWPGDPLNSHRDCGVAICSIVTYQQPCYHKNPSACVVASGVDDLVVGLLHVLAGLTHHRAYRWIYCRCLTFLFYVIPMSHIAPGL